MALRSYLITGDSKELANYNNAREVFYSNIENLKAITNSNQVLELTDKFTDGEKTYHKIAEKMIAAKQQNDIEEYTRIMNEEDSEAREGSLVSNRAQERRQRKAPGHRQDLPRCMGHARELPEARRHLS